MRFITTVMVSAGVCVGEKGRLHFVGEKAKVNAALPGTSSPAVAERPRDASCLSVVTLNSTISQAQYSILYFYFRFIAAYTKFCSVIFCSAYSLMRGCLCGVNRRAL